MHRGGIVGCATKRLFLVMFENLFRSLYGFSKDDLEAERLLVVGNDGGKTVSSLC